MTPIKIVTNKNTYNSFKLIKSKCTHVDMNYLVINLNN